MSTGRQIKVERRGRPKKPGRRTPSGRLITDREIVEARVIAFRQPHRQGAPESKRHDPKATWPLGILNLTGAINDDEYQAGVLYGRDVRRYRAHYLADGPDPSPQSIAGFMEPRGGGGQSVSDDHARKIRDSYNAAVEAVMDAGQKAAKAVARMAVFGEPCPVGLDFYLKLGLAALVKHYGLTRR